MELIRDSVIKSLYDFPEKDNRLISELNRIISTHGPQAYSVILHVLTHLGYPDPVIVARYRGEIRDANNIPAMCVTTDPGQHTGLPVVPVNPLEPLGQEVALEECRRAPVQRIDIAHQVLYAAVEIVL